MVATPQSDRLSYIFPVDLENAGDRVEEALKMQRLHPAYRADFLLQYRTSEGMVNVIIEYDGFQEHFEGHGKIHAGNHARYYRPEDIARQMVLESYG
jgi:hypothetical protein